MQGKKPPYLLGIDASTQSATACVWTPDGKLVGKGSSPLKVDRPSPGRAEQDPSRWWTSIRKAIRGALDGLDAERIAGVGVAYQRETFSMVDGKGEFVRPGILWLDVRADEEVRELAKLVGRSSYHRQTGKPLDVTSAAARLLWLKKHEPATLKRTARLVDVGGELAYRLTGRYATCSGGTDTCGLVSLSRRRWIERYLALAELTPAQCPDLVEPGEVVGGISAAAAGVTGLAAGTPVVAGGGDGNVFPLGMGVTGPHRLSLTLGTSIVLGFTSPEPVIDPMFRTLIAPDGYLLECVLQSGTYLLRWFVERFGAPGLATEGDWDREAAGIPAGCEGLVTLPNWWGVRFPENLPDARGATLGWSDHHTPVHFYRSLLEGLAMETRRCVDRLGSVLPVKRGGGISVGSGGARSDEWMRILAGVLNRTVARSTESEATAMGAAMLAGVSVGCFRSLGSAAKRMAAGTERTKPTKRTAGFYSELYTDVYRPLFEKTAAISAKLRSISF